MDDSRGDEALDPALEAWASRCRGRRDIWRWVLGLGGAVARVGELAALVILVGVTEMDPALRSALVVAVIGAGVSVAFFLGKRWSRWGLLLLTGVDAVIALDKVGFGAAAMVFSIWGILESVENKLSFGLEPDARALKKAWHSKKENNLVWWALAATLLGFLFPPLGALGLVMALGAAYRGSPWADPVGRWPRVAVGVSLLALLPTGWMVRAFMGGG